MNIDDCFSERNRSADGDIIASKLNFDYDPSLDLNTLYKDKITFPSGMKYLTDRIHELGL